MFTNSAVDPSPRLLRFPLPPDYSDLAANPSPQLRFQLPEDHSVTNNLATPPSMLNYTSIEELYRLPILESPEDFNLWRAVIEDYLTSLGLWHEIMGADPDVVPAKPNKDNYWFAPSPFNSKPSASAMNTGFRSFGFKDPAPAVFQVKRPFQNERYRKDSKDFWEWKARDARVRMVMRSTVSEDLNRKLPAGSAHEMYTFICKLFDTHAVAKEESKEEAMKEAKKELKTEVKKGIKKEAEEEVKKEVRTEIKTEAEEEIKEDSNEKAKDKVKGESKEEAKEEAKEKA
ncbi:hypothetical protein BC567DRAFT_263687 [Phyllosticta citribraziliensis]